MFKRLDRFSKACSKDETRYHLCNILVDGASGRYVASDGYIAAMMPMSDDEKTYWGDGKCLLSPKTIKAVISDKATHTVFDSATCTITTDNASQFKLERMDGDNKDLFPASAIDKIVGNASKNELKVCLNVELLHRLATALTWKCNGNPKVEIRLNPSNANAMLHVSGFDEADSTGCICVLRQP